MVRLIWFTGLAAWALSVSSCTTARWTVKSMDAVDRNETEVIDTGLFLAPEGTLTPDNPVLRLNLLSRNTYEHPRKVLLQRTMQDYRPRAGFVALGLSGAAAAFYAANSQSLAGGGSSIRSITLNTAGAALVLSGFLNMKPVGEPRATGEERYLRDTGSVIETDTSSVTGTPREGAAVSVTYDGRTILEEGSREITSGTLEIQLANILDDLQLSGSDPGQVAVRVDFADSTYAYNYPVSDILLPFARITAPLTVLRSTPEESPGNVLAELLRGSQLQVQRIENDRWFRVLYGTSENFILRNDARLIWRPSGFISSSAGSVVTASEIPFGNIDVENNIPILRNTNENAYALIVTNENYSGQRSTRNYSHRDGRLLKTYLRIALGYPDSNILEIRDLENPRTLSVTTSRLARMTNDSSEVFVFLNGHGEAEQTGIDRYELYLRTVSDEDEEPDNPRIALRTFYEQLSGIPSRQMLVLNDLGFEPAANGMNLSRSENRIIFSRHISALTNSNRGASVVIGSGIDQQSGLYVSAGGDDKKHHIFPYFFAQALQKRQTDLPTIFQYLERNVSYTSRRLHDLSQDPFLFGTTAFDFIPE